MSGSAVTVLAGYDGSLAAGVAIEQCARLLPSVRAEVAHMWTPPFASEQLRRRLWKGTRQVDAFVQAVEREGQREAERVASMGVKLARAAGWTADPLVTRCYSGEGFELTQLARRHDVDLLLVGARGLGGARAVLGSVSDMAVHYATQPVLVAPHPLLAADEDALPRGPVLMAWDGSAGARTALDAAMRLWPRRPFVVTSVDHDDDPPVLPGAPDLTVVRAHSRHRSPHGIADALAATAHDHGAALIVLGSRGRSAALEIVLGSVAMSTLHRAHHLVMVVPRTDRTDTGPQPEPDA